MTEVYKIAIIGSGPAGMSAAAHAARKGVSHVLLEKTDHLSDTIFRYQKGKHVMATPAVLVLRADCEFDAGKRPTLQGLRVGGQAEVMAFPDAGNPLNVLGRAYLRLMSWLSYAY